MKRVLVLIALATCTASYAETHITGDIHGMAFDETGSPYIVEQDVLIPAGKKVTVNEGCVFLFKAFTGLHIQGTIVINGSAQKPVIFTSVHDGEYSPQAEQLPNPFDWNGILVARESGGAFFKNFALKYSVYGIKSQIADIQIENGTFYQNGQFHFTINDKIQFVQDNVPYSYNVAGAPATGQVMTGQTGEAKAAAAAKGPVTKKRKIVRYSCLGVGIAGIVGSGVCTILAVSSSNERKGNVAKLSNVDEYDRLTKQLNVRTGLAIGTGALGVIGLVGFGLTFAL